MYYIGDVHGKIKEYRRIIRSLPAGAKSLQLGDMGIGFKGVHLFPGGSMDYRNRKHLFIRGNHDDPAKCRKHLCYAGDYGYLSDEKLFYLGGAWSIDHAWRIPGVSWWPDEELNLEELNKAAQLYMESKPEIVATHEAPSKAAMIMLSSLIIAPAHEPCPTDQGIAVKQEDYQYYKEKLGCVNTRTSRVLQQMFEAWQPKYWLFGHYHARRCFLLGRTEFNCLGELDVLEINLNEKNVNT